jgi:hypothetical protein
MQEQRSLILENLVQNPQEWGLRLYSDGAIEVLSDRWMSFENGEIVTHLQPLEWRWEVTLTTEEMSNLFRVIRSSGVMDLPEVMTSAVPESSPIFSYWKVQLDGREVQIQAVGSQASNHPVFSLLSREIQTVKALAMQRKYHKKRGEAKN